MSDKPENPSAFPHASSIHEDLTGEHYIINSQIGMTLRDYFAAAALQGVLSSGKVINAEGVPETAYKYADAMLKARG